MEQHSYSDQAIGLGILEAVISSGLNLDDTRLEEFLWYVDGLLKDGDGVRRATAYTLVYNAIVIGPIRSRVWGFCLQRWICVEGQARVEWEIGVLSQFVGPTVCSELQDLLFSCLRDDRLIWVVMHAYSESSIQLYDDFSRYVARVEAARMG